VKTRPRKVSFQIFMHFFVRAGEETCRIGYIMQEHLGASQNKRNSEGNIEQLILTFTKPVIFIDHLRSLWSKKPR